MNLIAVSKALKTIGIAILFILVFLSGLVNAQKCSHLVSRGIYNSMTGQIEIRLVVEPIPGCSESVGGGVIEKVWVDYDAKEDKITGMRIHLKFSISGLKDNACKVNVYFRNSSGTALIPNSDVGVAKSVKPLNQISSYDDFTVFMPYSQFPRFSGKRELQFQIEIHDETKASVVNSDIYFFSLTS